MPLRNIPPTGVKLACWAKDCEGHVLVNPGTNLPAGLHTLQASCDTCGQDYKITATVFRSESDNVDWNAPVKPMPAKPMRTPERGNHY